MQHYKVIGYAPDSEPINLGFTNDEKAFTDAMIETGWKKTWLKFIKTESDI